MHGWAANDGMNFGTKNTAPSPPAGPAAGETTVMARETVSRICEVKNHEGCDWLPSDCDCWCHGMQRRCAEEGHSWQNSMSAFLEVYQDCRWCGETRGFVPSELRRRLMG